MNTLDKIMCSSTH